MTPEQDQVPTFVVVGHPNKGKSSIVATLAQDAGVAIEDASGTTRVAQRFPMRVDGKVLYELVDTPGFQRARRALAWLQSRGVAAHERPSAVRDFISAHDWSTPGDGGNAFADECELLKPIMAGDTQHVGILYVVDGSVPYSEIYEAEMEILRWSGRPSLALVNPIGDADRYVAQWDVALRQFFSTVRVFNAVTASFERQISLLRTFGELQPSWREPMRRAVTSLEARRARQRKRALRIIARLLVDASVHIESRQIALDADPAPSRAELGERFRRHLRRRERATREDIESLYGYARLERDEELLQLLDTDLFDERVRKLFGLTRAQAARLGAVGGAGAGLAADLAVAGSSFGLAAVAGGIAGGAAAWFGHDQLGKADIVRITRLGVTQVRIGPLRNAGLRRALINRALTHLALVSQRTHASKGALVGGEPVRIDDQTAKQVNTLLDGAASTQGDDLEALEESVAQALEPFESGGADDT